MKAAVIDAQKHLVIQEVSKPGLPDGGAIIRVVGCGICGSDLDKLLHRDMPEGTILGHEVVGTIDTLSLDAQRRLPHLKPGQRVAVAHHVPCQHCYYCRHQSPSMCSQFKATNIFPGGFGEWIAVSGDHLRHTVLPIPNDVTDAQASCIEPLACCVRAVDRIPEYVGKNTVVIGLGFIGLMTSWYLGHQGYQVNGLDLQPERVELGRKANMLDAADTDSEALLTSVYGKTDGRGADVVFLTVVNPATLTLAFQAVRDGGLIMLFTSYGDNMPILDQNALYFREITVMTSYSPSLQHLRKAYDLIVQKAICVAPLITQTCTLQELAQTMTEYKNGKLLKAFVTV